MKGDTVSFHIETAGHSQEDFSHCTSSEQAAEGEGVRKAEKTNLLFTNQPPATKTLCKTGLWL